MFKRFFKPKWQHISADIRKQAIQKLDQEKPEEYDILRQLARTDESVEVRCAAIDRLEKLGDLVELLDEVHGSQTIEDGLHHRISVLLCASPETSLPEKISILKRVKEPSLFRYVVKNGSQVELQVAATEMLVDQETLEDIAIHAKSIKVRQKAVEQITDPDLLRIIEQATKSKDKAIYKIAKDKLADLKEEIEKKEQAEQEALRIILAVENHAQSQVEPLYESRLQLLKKQWQALSVPQQTPFKDRWMQAESSCLNAIEHWRVNEADNYSDDIVSADAARTEQNETLDVLNQALSLIKEETDLLQLDLPALQGIVATQQVRWQRTLEHVETAEQDRRNFEALIIEIKDFLEPARRLKDRVSHIQKIEFALESQQMGDYQELKQIIKRVERLQRELDWPSRIGKPALIRVLESALEKARKQVEQLDNESKAYVQAIQTGLQELESSINEGSVKTSQKILNRLQEKMKRVDTQRVEKFNGTFKLLQGRFRELKDWQGYANTPKKEALVAEMEQLIQGDIEPQELAQQIKGLQETWKTLGPAEANRERALWQAFKEAGDKAFEPCRVYYQEQAEIRKVNIEKRIELCEQLEAYERQNDWGRADWNAVLETIKTAKAEWRERSPVEKKANQSVQQRFDKVVSQIQSRLDETRSRNARLKARIVEQAQALIDHENLDEAISRAKALQQEWRAVGPTHRKEDRDYWKQFRAACDKLFDQRSQQKEGDDLTRKNNQAELESMCARLEEILSLDAQLLLEKQSEFRQMQSELDSLGALPAASGKALRQHWSDLAQQFLVKTKEAEQRVLQQGYLRMWDKAELCRTLENKILAGELSDQLLGDIKSQWVLLGELPTAAEVSLNARFDLAISHSGQDAHLDDYREMAKRKADLCRTLAIRMEIISGIDSPQSDQELRMQLQVARLSSGMQSKGENQQQAMSEDRAIELQWCANGPVDAALYSQFAGRFEQALKKVRA